MRVFSSANFERRSSMLPPYSFCRRDHQEGVALPGQCLQLLHKQLVD